MVEDTEQTRHPADESFPASEFRPLDRRVIGLWRLNNFIGSGVLLVALLLGSTFEGLIWSRGSTWVFAGLVGVALLLAWYSWWRPPRVYRAWGYRVDRKVLETRSGILFHITRLLPLTRLQHVDLERGPLERMFGLASLVLHTAGTHAARITIPGLDTDEAVRLRDYLVEIGGDDAV